MSQPDTAPHQAWITRSVALYQRLLVLYPPAFHRAYQAQLVQTFRDTCRQATQERGLPGLLGCWLILLADLASNAIAERFLEGLSMSHTTLIRLVGLLTLVSIVVLIPTLLLTSTSLFTTGPVLVFYQAQVITGSFTLPSGGEPFMVLSHIYSPIALAAKFLVACCFALVLLGVMLAQRSLLGRISAGLALLGQVGMLLFTGLLWVFNTSDDLHVLTSSDVTFLWFRGFLLPLVAGLALSVGCIVCGLVNLKIGFLPGWKGLLLLLGLWLGAGTLGLLWLQLTRPTLYVEGTLFIGYASGSSFFWLTLCFTLYALISYGLWAWLAVTMCTRKSAPHTQIQAAIA